jgi:hypothetical protein
LPGGSRGLGDVYKRQICQYSVGSGSGQCVVRRKLKSIDYRVESIDFPSLLYTLLSLLSFILYALSEVHAPPLYTCV